MPEYKIKNPKTGQLTTIEADNLEDFYHAMQEQDHLQDFEFQVQTPQGWLLYNSYIFHQCFAEGSLSEAELLDCLTIKAEQVEEEPIC